jgi:hypothetical protein
MLYLGLLAQNNNYVLLNQSNTLTGLNEYSLLPTCVNFSPVSPTNYQFVTYQMYLDTLQFLIVNTNNEFEQTNTYSDSIPTVNLSLPYSALNQLATVKYVTNYETEYKQTLTNINDSYTWTELNIYDSCPECTVASNDPTNQFVTLAEVATLFGSQGNILSYNNVIPITQTFTQPILCTSTVNPAPTNFITLDFVNTTFLPLRTIYCNYQYQSIFINEINLSAYSNINTVSSKIMNIYMGYNILASNVPLTYNIFIGNNIANNGVGTGNGPNYSTSYNYNIFLGNNIYYANNYSNFNIIANAGKTNNYIDQINQSMSNSIIYTPNYTFFKSTSYDYDNIIALGVGNFCYHPNTNVSTKNNIVMIGNYSNDYLGYSNTCNSSPAFYLNTMNANPTTATYSTQFTYFNSLLKTVSSSAFTQPTSVVYQNPQNFYTNTGNTFQSIFNCIYIKFNTTNPLYHVYNYVDYLYSFNYVYYSFISFGTSNFICPFNNIYYDPFFTPQAGAQTNEVELVACINPNCIGYKFRCTLIPNANQNCTVTLRFTTRSQTAFQTTPFAVSNLEGNFGFLYQTQLYNAYGDSTWQLDGTKTWEFTVVKTPAMPPPYGTNDDDYIISVM